MEIPWISRHVSNFVLYILLTIRDINQWVSYYLQTSKRRGWIFSQFSSFAQSCLTLCNPVDCSVPGFHVHHQLLELTETHVHWLGNAIQPSCPLSSPSLPAFNLSQHQGLFPWVSSLYHLEGEKNNTPHFSIEHNGRKEKFSSTNEILTLTKI